MGNSLYMYLTYVAIKFVFLYVIKLANTKHRVFEDVAIKMGKGQSQQCARAWTINALLELMRQF
jgi:hypothetical protein